MILRDHLNQITNVNDLYTEINTINGEKGCNITSTEQIEEAYSEIINKIKNGGGSPQNRPIVVEWVDNHFYDPNDKEDVEKYIDVSLLNLDYVEPPEGCKPWGGENHPEGYYNINDNKYNKRFAISCEKWNDLGDYEVINSAELSNIRLVAEILFECTFNGYAESDRDAFFEDLNRRIDEIKNGERDALKFNSVDEMMDYFNKAMEKGEIEELKEKIDRGIIDDDEDEKK